MVGRERIQSPQVGGNLPTGSKPVVLAEILLSLLVCFGEGALISVHLLGGAEVSEAKSLSSGWVALSAIEQGAPQEGADTALCPLHLQCASLRFSLKQHFVPAGAPGSCLW